MPLVGPEEYRAVRKPLAQASTMPPRVYSSAEWYEREVETIFKKGWLVAIREEEIPNPGDYVRVDFFDEPLVVVRGNDGVIRTLSAACRHRGAEIVSGKGNCRALVCPYHAWSYSLSGELLAAPSMEAAEGFDRSNCRLPSVRTETWGGFVCVNFDDDAKSLRDTLGDLVDRFASYRMEDMRIVRIWSTRVKCNWKVWAENSREGYHLATVHRPSLERFRPNGYTIRPFDAVVKANEYAINSGPLDLSFGVAENPIFPFHAGISEYDLTHAHYIVSYPHVLINLQPDKMVYHQIFPEGPESITLNYIACFPISTIERSGFEKAVEEYFPAAEMAISEDKEICEAQQRGLRGTLAAQGRFSPREEATVHGLAEYVLDRVLGSNVALRNPHDGPSVSTQG